MGKVMSIVSRRLNRFNIENRAHRVLELDKPTPAPKYESNIRDMKRALEADPALSEKLYKKDEALYQRLKRVYVTSQDISVEDVRKQIKSENRPLPLIRAAPEDFLYGYREPKIIKPGRCTLKQAMEFMSNHQDNPETWTVKHIADEYKLKEEDVANVLKYSKTLKVIMPERNKEVSKWPQIPVGTKESA